MQLEAKQVYIHTWIEQKKLLDKSTGRKEDSSKEVK